MLTFFQKNKLKLLLLVFCVALILPLIGFARPTIAQTVDECVAAGGDLGTCRGMEEASTTGGSDVGGQVNNKSEKSFFDGSWTIVPILKMVLKFDGMLLSAAQTIFEWIIVPDNMTAVMNNSAVYDMWRFVRDFFNTSLIMILLFSAFATIFQASTGYHYKKVLLNLVIMALLVNFSYPISRFIIDMSNVFMYGFLNQLGGAGSFWSIIEKSGVHKIIGGANPDIAYLFAAVIFTFMFAVTMVTIAILLVIRTIALTIFIIFSPIAFLGSTQPGTDLANAASGWWKEFMKYCFAGPIMIFMLVLANQMIIAISSASNGLGTIAKLQANNADLSGLIASISFFSLPLVILWLGIERAQSSGIAGAGMVVGTGTKLMNWTGKTFSGYRAGKWFATKAVPAMTKAGMEKFEESVLAPRGLSPTAFKEAWKQRAKESRDRAITPAKGAWHDRLNSFFSLGKDKTKFKDAGLQANIAREQKDMAAYSENIDVLLSELDSAREAKKGDKVAAILRIIWGQNDQNDLLEYNNIPVTPEGKKQFLYDTIKAAGIEDDQIFRQMNDIGEIAFGKGNFADYGMIKFDKDTKKFRLAKKTIDEKTGKVLLDEQADASVGKSTNVEPQEKLKKWHWNALLEQLKDPVKLADGTTTNAGGLHDIGKAHLQSMTMLEVKQVQRARKDFINKTYARREDIERFAAEVEKDDKQQAEVIRAFLEEVKEKKFGSEKELKELREKRAKAPSTIVDQHGRPISS